MSNMQNSLRGFDGTLFSIAQFKQLCKRLTGGNDWPYRQLSCLDRQITRWSAELAQSAHHSCGNSSSALSVAERSDLERAIALARHTKVRLHPHARLRLCLRGASWFDLLSGA